jgi:transglutaminase-like putative cysteine protease
MANRFRIVHHTAYRYSMPMTDGYSVAFVVPRTTPWQTVELADVAVLPEPDERIERVDLFGNRVLQLGVHHQHDALSVTATSEVTVEDRVVDLGGAPWEEAAAAVAELRGSGALDVRPFAGGVAMVSEDGDRAAMQALAGETFTPGVPVVDGARALCRTIHERFEYDPSFTEVSTPLSTVLAARRGVCQDFAHLAIGALRTCGLAARYVSGYIETATSPEQPAEASHAWCSLWVPGIGWVDFDPTNDQFPARRHVTVAWGRDYGDVAPLRGVVIGPPASQQLSVAVEVTHLPSTRVL